MLWKTTPCQKRIQLQFHLFENVYRNLKCSTAHTSSCFAVSNEKTDRARREPDPRHWKHRPLFCFNTSGKLVPFAPFPHLFSVRLRIRICYLGHLGRSRQPNRLSLTMRKRLFWFKKGGVISHTGFLLVSWLHLAEERTNFDFQWRVCLGKLENTCVFLSGRNDKYCFCNTEIIQFTFYHVTLN